MQRSAVNQAFGQGERPQQERSRLTQEKLLQAAIDLLVERGYGGWRFADVAARAEVSLGALTHHFPDKVSLLVAVAETICARSLDDGLNQVKRISDRDGIVRKLVEALKRAYFTPDYFALREAGNAAHSNKTFFPRIAPFVTEYRTRINEGWLKAFTGVGYPNDQSETVISISVNMIRGMAAHGIWRPDAHTFDHVLSEWANIGQRYLDGATNDLPRMRGFPTA